MRVNQIDATPDKLAARAIAYWLATEFDYIVGAWNTNLVQKAEAPKEFDDFADPRWKGRLIAEPRDVELLVGLAKYKFKSDEKAIALLRRIAANDVQFHRGHSAIAELLVAGQAVACVTCFSHHYPPRIKKAHRSTTCFPRGSLPSVARRY